jgi:phage terminase large subunit-like protein
VLQLQYDQRPADTAQIARSAWWAEASDAERWAAVTPPDEQRRQLGALSEDEADALLHDWSWYARTKQKAPPGPWFVWLLLAGRGFGKTRTGVEWVKERVISGKAKRIALVGRTAEDVRDVMVCGESGLLSVLPKRWQPVYRLSSRHLRWPNGVIATMYSADRPDQLRGPQHDTALADELAAWRFPDAWHQLLLGMRLGEPAVAVATTPRPTPIIRDLLRGPRTVVVRGTTYENLVNIAGEYREAVLGMYEGTRLGRQELNAEVLEQNEGALWDRDRLDAQRVRAAPELRRVVVGVDPPASSNGAECGIVVAALGVDGHGYCVGDYSVRGSPEQWSRNVIRAYAENRANIIVAEGNQGGDMVRSTIAGAWREYREQGGEGQVDPPVKVVYASRGKLARAEPVSALDERGKIHHVGVFAELEDQLTDWAPGEGRPSPDRLDAYVWAFTSLFGRRAPTTVGPLELFKPQASEEMPWIR